MRALLALLIAPVALAAPVPKALKRAADDRMIVGRWELLSVDHGDGPAPPDRSRAGNRYEFRTGGEYEFNYGNGKPRDDGTARYSLDPTADPKRLDLHWQNDGRKLFSPELYHLDGDTLSVCGPVQWGGQRPAEFKAVRGKVSVSVYARVK